MSSLWKGMQEVRTGGTLLQVQPMQGESQSSSKKRVEDSDLPSDYEEANYSSEDETIKRVKQDTSSSSIWPGVSSNSRTSHVRRVSSGGGAHNG